jgi:hypothetical protein
LAEVVAWFASCACAKAGRNKSPAAAAKTVFKRKTALIAPALSRDSPLKSSRAAPGPMPSACL